MGACSVCFSCVRIASSAFSNVHPPMATRPYPGPSETLPVGSTLNTRRLAVPLQNPGDPDQHFISRHDGMRGFNPQLFLSRLARVTSTAGLVRMLLEVTNALFGLFQRGSGHVGAAIFGTERDHAARFDTEVAPDIVIAFQRAVDTNRNCVARLQLAPRPCRVMSRRARQTRRAVPTDTTLLLRAVRDARSPRGK